MLPQLAASLLTSSRPFLGIASSSRPLIGVSSVAFVSSGVHYSSPADVVQHSGAALGLVGSRAFANDARPASTGAPADETMTFVAGMGPTAMDATAHMVNTGASAASSRYLDPDSAPRHAAKVEPETVNDHTANLKNTPTSSTQAAKDAAAPTGVRSYSTNTAPMTTSAVFLKTTSALAAAVAGRPAAAMSSSAVFGTGTARGLSTSTFAAYGVHIVEDASAKTSKVATSEDVGGTAPPSQKAQEVAGQSGGHGYRSTVPSDLQGWATIMGEGLGMFGAASIRPFKFTAMATATLSRRMIDALSLKGIVGYGLNVDTPKSQYIPTAPWPAAYVNPARGSSSTPYVGDSQLVNSAAGAAYGVSMTPAGGKRSLFGSGGGARGYSTAADDGSMHVVGDVARAAMHSVEETAKSAVRSIEDVMLNPSAAAASVTHSLEGAVKSAGTVAGVITDMPSVDKPIVQDAPANGGRATAAAGGGSGSARGYSGFAATSGHSRSYGSSSATVGDRVKDTAQSVADSAKHAMSAAKETAKAAGERTADALGLTDAAMGVTFEKNDEGSGLPKGSTKADQPSAVPAGVDKIGGDHPNIPQISTLGSTAVAPRKYSTSATVSRGGQLAGTSFKLPITCAQLLSVSGRSLVGRGSGNTVFAALVDASRSFGSSTGSSSADKPTQIDEKNIYDKARKEDLSNFNVEDRAKNNAKTVGNTILHPIDTLKKAAENTASRTTEALAHADAEGLGPTTARDGKEADTFAGSKGSKSGSN